MHELGLAEGILAVVLEAAGGEPVRRISLLVGKRQMVAPDSLEFSFRLLAEGTVAAQAGFAIQEVPIRSRCRQCGGEGEVELAFWSCGECGSLETEILSGDELLVDAVELENGRIIRRSAAGDAS
jgi:hydrogenase nickel incorporation protein HypA/HybF